MSKENLDWQVFFQSLHFPPNLNEVKGTENIFLRHASLATFTSCVVVGLLAVVIAGACEYNQL